jgi:hypothetical protein
LQAKVVTRFRVNKGWSKVKIGHKNFKIMCNLATKEINSLAPDFANFSHG